jgi:hypothetical protein
VTETRPPHLACALRSHHPSGSAPGAGDPSCGGGNDDGGGGGLEDAPPERGDGATPDPPPRGALARRTRGRRGRSVASSVYGPVLGRNPWLTTPTPTPEGIGRLARRAGRATRQGSGEMEARRLGRARRAIVIGSGAGVRWPQAAQSSRSDQRGAEIWPRAPAVVLHVRRSRMSRPFHAHARRRSDPRSSQGVTAMPSRTPSALRPMATRAPATEVTIAVVLSSKLGRDQHGR